MKRFSLLLTLVLVCCAFVTACQTTRQEANNRIKQWYEQHPTGYNLKLKGQGKITRYHIDRPKEKDDLIQITWKGMTITLAFKQPLSNFALTSKNLQENLAYYVLDHIYTDISLSGWQVHPQTPSSSAMTGLVFQEASSKKVRFSIDWEIYTVYGYSQSAYCQGQLEVADTSLPKECFIGVDKSLPLRLDVEAVLP